MALSKPIENPENAVVCQYWNIRTFQADLQDRTLVVYMDGFITEDARWDQKKPVTTMQLALDPETLMADFLAEGVTITDIYVQIKGQVQVFGDAEDVIETPPQEA